MNGLNKVLTKRVSQPKRLPEHPAGSLRGSNRALTVAQPVFTPLDTPSVVLTNHLITQVAFPVEKGLHHFPGTGGAMWKLLRPPKDLFACSLGNLGVPNFYI